MKDVMFVGTSRNDLRKFPQEVRQEAGYQLFRVQYGTVPNDWKPIKTIGKNVKEIRIHVEGEYRIIYVAHFEEAVYVLHAFQKKTQKTPQHDIELARKRFQQIEREKS
jgi:phage-related protein